ncbi:MAG: TOBE domain-containing protein [Acidimicrobiales bacterium]
MGVRPESLSLVGASPGSGPGFGAVVERTELIGAERILHLTCESIRMAAKVPARGAPAPGARVQLAVAPEGVRLFDAATGRSLGAQPAETGRLARVGRRSSLAGGPVTLASPRPTGSTHAG